MKDLMLMEIKMGRERSYIMMDLFLMETSLMIKYRVMVFMNGLTGGSMMANIKITR